MSKRQSYQNRNRGFMRMIVLISTMFSNTWKWVTYNQTRNSGKAGGHLDTSYHSGGGSGSHYNMPIAPHKAAIEKKRRRKEIQKSQRINRKRKANVCSFK